MKKILCSFLVRAAARTVTITLPISFVTSQKIALTTVPEAPSLQARYSL